MISGDFGLRSGALGREKISAAFQSRSGVSAFLARGPGNFSKALPSRDSLPQNSTRSWSNFFREVRGHRHSVQGFLQENPLVFRDPVQVHHDLIQTLLQNTDPLPNTACCSRVSTFQPFLYLNVLHDLIAHFLVRLARHVHLANGNLASEPNFTWGNAFCPASVVRAT